MSHLKINSVEKLFGLMPDGEQVCPYELINEKGTIMRH